MYRHRHCLVYARAVAFANYLGDGCGGGAGVQCRVGMRDAFAAAVGAARFLIGEWQMRQFVSALPRHAGFDVEFLGVVGHRKVYYFHRQHRSAAFSTAKKTLGGNFAVMGIAEYCGFYAQRVFVKLHVCRRGIRCVCHARGKNADI